MKKIILLLIFFTLLVVAGIFLGEPLHVFKKAVSVCLSCMGIAS
jgi:hypothetical protein